MITVAQWVVILSGVWLIVVSGFMLASPQTALQYLGKMASTNLINYSEISLRMISGIALVLYAELSKFPEVFRIFGFFLAGTSAVLFLVPRKWHAHYASYWSNRLSAPFVRIFAPFSLALGIFLIYAIVPD